MGIFVALANGSRLYLTLALCLGAVTLGGCSSVESAAEPTAQASVSLDGGQLQKILEEFAQSDDVATVITDQKLRTSIPKAQEWIKSVKVNPSKCGGTFAEPVADQLKNATMGAVKFKHSYLTVSIYADSEALAKAWDAKRAANEQCSRYSVTSRGETRAYHLAERPMDSNAEKDESYVVTSSDGKSTQQQLVVRSATSNLLIGIHQSTSRSQTQKQIETATATINELLGQLN